MTTLQDELLEVIAILNGEPYSSSASTWDVQTETRTFRPLLSKDRRIRYGSVAYRVCPHGVPHFDSNASGALAQNAFMFIPDPCRDEGCKRAWRKYRDDR